MHGRTVLVTGATSGIGRAAALGLAGLGARVAVVGRDHSRVAATVREIRSDGGEAEPFVADLSAQTDVRRLAAEVLGRLDRLDVLVNNVGGFWNTRRTTVDGLEHTFAVNHLAAFLLTRLLLDRLRQRGGARVVTVASNAQSLGRIDFDDLQAEHGYSGARAYNQSKLANVMFTYELARRLAGTQVTANALHPGVVSTNLGAEDPGWTQRLVVPLVRPFMRRPRDGASSVVALASDAALAQVTGKFFSHGSPTRSSRRSYDTADGLRLWDVCTRLVGLPDTA
jgi:retinol dehydrogenase 14